MNIHEYQAKELLAKFGVPVPAGYRGDERRRGGGGGGQASRARLCRQGADPRRRARQGQVQGAGPTPRAASASPRRLRRSAPNAAEMLGNTLVTIQTGAAGQAGQPPLHHRRRRYREGISTSRLLVDRETGRIAMVASTEGGMDIEKVAHDTPEKIDKITIDPATGFCRTTAARLPPRCGLTGDLAKQAAKLADAALQALPRHRLRRMIEINPLVGHQGRQAARARRQGRLRRQRRSSATRTSQQLRDLTEEDPMEIEASKYDLAYIKLDGNIGCMVNGAGLAMATMDIIKLNGGEPGQLPRRRRRRLEGEGDRGVQDHPQRSGGEGHPRQHLRRHHALRHHRRRHRRGGEGSEPERAAGRPPRRHQRRSRARTSSPIQRPADRRRRTTWAMRRGRSWPR